MTRPALLWIAAVLAWAGLALRCTLSIDQYLAQGDTAWAALSRLLNYFTILTNLVVAAYCTARLRLRDGPAARWLAHPAVGTGVAINIGFVAVVYAVLLQHLSMLMSWAKVADWLLHYVGPTAFLLYWAVCVPRGQLHWRHPLLWALYPLGYGAYALLRGAWSGYYPYPFLDVNAIGYGGVAVQMAGLSIAFCVAGELLVALDRFQASRRAIDRSAA